MNLNIYHLFVLYKMSNNQSTIGKTSASEVNDNSRILYGFCVTSLFKEMIHLILFKDCLVERFC